MESLLSYKCNFFDKKNQSQNYLGNLISKIYSIWNKTSAEKYISYCSQFLKNKYLFKVVSLVAMTKILIFICSKYFLHSVTSLFEGRIQHNSINQWQKSTTNLW